MIVLKNTLRSYIRYPALNNHHHHQGSFRGLLPSSSSKTGAANLCDVSRLNKFGLETMWRVYFKTGIWMARIERAFFSPLLPSSPPPSLRPLPPTTTHNHRLVPQHKFSPQRPFTWGDNRTEKKEKEKDSEFFIFFFLLFINAFLSVPFSLRFICWNCL